MNTNQHVPAENVVRCFEPLVVCDSPERCQVISAMYSNLLESIQIIGQREEDILKLCLPDLIRIADEIMDALNESVRLHVAECDEAANNPPCQCASPGERRGPRRAAAYPVRAEVQYLTSPVRTRYLSELSASLMHCIAVISRRKQDGLKDFLDDLIGIALEIALVLKGDIEETLGEDTRPEICDWCRGKKRRPED